MSDHTYQNRLVEQARRIVDREFTPQWVVSDALGCLQSAGNLAAPICKVEKANVGAMIQECMPSELVQLVRDGIAVLSRTGELSFSSSTTIKLCDQIYHICLTLRTLASEAQEPANYLAVFQATGVQKNADSQSQFRMLADNIPQLAWIADPDGRVTWYNKRWYDYTGTTPAEMQNRGWTAMLHADHQERVAQKIRQAHQLGESWEDISRLRGREGQYRWFLTRMTPITDEENKVVRWFGTSTDITEQKASEHQLRNSTNQLRLAARLAGFATAEIDYVNDEMLLTEPFARMYGLSSDQLVVSRQTVHALFHPDDQHWLEKHIDEAIGEARDQILSLDHRIVRPDGQTRWVSVRKHLIHEQRDSGERVLRQSLVAVQDITDRKETETELENAKLLAEAANQAKSDFLANMSHEIRSPMTAILGFAELLQTDSEEDRERIDTIQRNGQFLLELVNDILDLSKIEAGKVDIDRVEFSPSQLVEDVCSLMSLRAAESDLEFSLIYDGPIPEKILNDPIRLRQILINLVGNAIKFTETGSVTLKVRYQKQLGRLQFDVIDTGIGISKEKQRNLFQPFEQGDSSIIRRYGGSGLGLAISQRLAELLNGQIGIQSEAGVGSTFSLTLSCPEVTATQVVANPEFDSKGIIVSPREPIDAKVATTPNSSGLLNVRVLVVDDRRDIRFLTQHLVKKWGGEVLVGETGLEALAIIADQTAKGRSIDIVLMDVQMPEMDGLTAVRKLRESGFDRPVIALTANAMESDRDLCLSAGYNDHLSKPIDSSNLLEMLRRHLQ